MEELIRCKICQENFNMVNKKPLVNNCGHTFCEFCVSTIRNNTNPKCPFCRKLIGGDISINHIMTMIINEFSELYKFEIQCKVHLNEICIYYDDFRTMKKYSEFETIMYCSICQKENKCINLANLKNCATIWKSIEIEHKINKWHQLFEDYKILKEKFYKHFQVLKGQYFLRQLIFEYYEPFMNIDFYMHLQKITGTFKAEYFEKRKPINDANLGTFLYFNLENLERFFAITKKYFKNHNFFHFENDENVFSFFKNGIFAQTSFLKDILRNSIKDLLKEINSLQDTLNIADKLQFLPLRYKKFYSKIILPDIVKVVNNSMNESTTNQNVILRIREHQDSTLISSSRLEILTILFSRFLSLKVEEHVDFVEFKNLRELNLISPDYFCNSNNTFTIPLQKYILNPKNDRIKKVCFKFPLFEFSDTFRGLLADIITNNGIEDLCILSKNLHSNLSKIQEPILKSRLKRFQFTCLVDLISKDQKLFYKSFIYQMISSSPQLSDIKIFPYILSSLDDLNIIKRLNHIENLDLSIVAYYKDFVEFALNSMGTFFDLIQITKNKIHLKLDEILMDENFKSKILYLENELDLINRKEEEEDCEIILELNRRPEIVLNLTNIILRQKFEKKSQKKLLIFYENESNPDLIYLILLKIKEKEYKMYLKFRIHKGLINKLVINDDYIISYDDKFAFLEFRQVQT